MVGRAGARARSSPGLVEQRHRRAQYAVGCSRPPTLRRARIDERLHVRQRVEEEMRRDLRLQQM